MLKKLYDWGIDRVSRPDGPRWLFGLSVAEATFFPIPPDVLMIPMVMADRQRAFMVALIATVGSIIGAVIGYFLGAFLFQEVALPILQFYGYEDRFDELAARFKDHGILIILIVGLTPIPFKLLALTAGATGLSFPLFFLMCFPARAPRFFLVAGLLYFIGEPIRDFIEKRLTLVFTLGVLLLVGGYFAVPLLLE